MRLACGPHTSREPRSKWQDSACISLFAPLQRMVSGEIVSVCKDMCMCMYEGVNACVCGVWQHVYVTQLDSQKS